MPTESVPSVAVNDCWRRIGIAGDRSCPELQTHIHCRSCPVYGSAAQAFFDRPAPDGYVAEWTQLLAHEKVGVAADSLSVLVFRLESEWLALPTSLLAEVTHPRPVHRVPHATDQTLVGIVNIRGSLQLCVSLHRMLDVAAGEAPGGGARAEEARAAQARLIVIENKAKRWAFPAEEVSGVERVGRNQFQDVPSTLTRVSSFSRAVFPWRGHTVGLLDEQRVFAALRSLGQ